MAPTTSISAEAKAKANVEDVTAVAKEKLGKWHQCVINLSEVLRDKDRKRQRYMHTNKRLK